MTIKRVQIIIKMIAAFFSLRFQGQACKVALASDLYIITAHSACIPTSSSSFVKGEIIVMGRG